MSFSIDRVEVWGWRSTLSSSVNREMVGMGINIITSVDEEKGGGEGVDVVILCKQEEDTGRDHGCDPVLTGRRIGINIFIQH